MGTQDKPYKLLATTCAVLGDAPINFLNLELSSRKKGINALQLSDKVPGINLSLRRDTS
jgi:hypothetical protein